MSRIEKLFNSIEIIANVMIDGLRWDNENSYNDEELIKLRAFFVLSHAEIEDYFEWLFMELTETSKTYLDSITISHPFINSSVRELYNQHKKVAIEKNNGIKFEKLKNMNIFFDFQEILNIYPGDYNTFHSSLAKLSKLRGDAAHTSISTIPSEVPSYDILIRNLFDLLRIIHIIHGLVIEHVTVTNFILETPIIRSSTGEIERTIFRIFKGSAPLTAAP